MPPVGRQGAGRAADGEEGRGEGARVPTHGTHAEGRYTTSQSCTSVHSKYRTALLKCQSGLGTRLQGIQGGGMRLHTSASSTLHRLGNWSNFSPLKWLRMKGGRSSCRISR